MLASSKPAVHPDHSGPVPPLTIRGLSQHFGSVRALDDVSLDVAPGEIVCLLGHSGCGKSTLLRLIAGLQTPSSGSIAIGERMVTDRTVFVEPELRSVGFMVQDFALFPHLNVLANVAFGLARRGSGAARDIALQALDRVGLRHLAERYPHMLSGGEQQRVALARALAPNPRVVLLDEPFSNLDRRTSASVRADTMALLREVSATVIMVTHDPEEAMHLADRIILMQSGRIVQSGPAEELYRRPVSLFAARFFSDLNEIDGICRNRMIETPLGRFGAGALRDGEAAVVCFRPQAVRLAPGGVPVSVIERRFLGGTRLLDVAIESGLRIQAYVSVDADVGAEAVLTVAVDPDDVMVFPADPTRCNPG